MKNNTSRWKTFLAFTVALIIFILTWFCLGFVIRVRDTLHGERYFLQDAFVDLICPIIAAYLSMIGIDKLFQGHNKWVVFYLFSAVIVIFFFYGLILMISVAATGEFTAYDYILSLLTPIVIVLAAHRGTSDIVKS